MNQAVTDGGRNPAYGGCFPDETPEMHLIRLAQARRIAALERDLTQAVQMYTDAAGERDKALADLAAAQADKEKWKALAEASAQLLETQASIRERDKRLADAERDEARAEAAALRDAKDDAYLERNMCVAALSKLFPATVSRTAIEGWSEDWHGCVYIDLPTGQVSWHFHDSQAHLFAHLPHGWVKWDGHDTPEKYARLAAIEARKEGA